MSIPRSLPGTVAALLVAASTLGLQSAEGQSGPSVIPPNPFCRVGACGFGRDGIPGPYPGRGITRLPLRAGDADDNVLGFAASRMSFLSWMTGVDITGVPTNASDIWGYTSPLGREYAIIGLKTGTAFVEITDPTAPRVTAMVDGVSSDWRDMAVYGEYAYSVNESGGGMQVIDLRQIDQGIVTLADQVTQMGLWTAHNIQVNEVSGYVYLLGSNLARGGLVAADLSDPSNPVIEPVAWNAAYVHDIQVLSYVHGPNKGREVVFALTGPFGLHVIDVTDKGSPTTLAHLPYRNATYGHSGALSPDGKFLYVNDELHERLDSDVGHMTTYVVRVRNGAAAPGQQHRVGSAVDRPQQHGAGRYALCVVLHRGPAPAGHHTGQEPYDGRLLRHPPGHRRGPFQRCLGHLCRLPFRQRGGLGHPARLVRAARALNRVAIVQAPTPPSRAIPNCLGYPTAC